MRGLEDAVVFKGTTWRFEMNNELRHPLTDLTAGSILRLRDGQGMAVVVFEGLVWITQSGDRRDIVLAAGESFSVDRPGLTLVQAFRDSKLMVVEGGPQAAPWPAQSSAELHQSARAQRSAAIGDSLAKGAVALRGVVAHAFAHAPRTPAPRPMTLCSAAR
jgi:hypothetical protein